jgi:hypothetical protein
MRVDPRRRKREGTRKQRAFYYTPIVRDRDNNRARQNREPAEGSGNSVKKSCSQTGLP